MSPLRIQTITSFDAPEVAPYRTMRRSSEHDVLGIFVAEGEKVVRRLLASHFTVVSIVLPEKWLAGKQADTGRGQRGGGRRGRIRTKGSPRRCKLAC